MPSATLTLRFPGFTGKQNGLWVLCVGSGGWTMPSSQDEMWNHCDLRRRKAGAQSSGDLPLLGHRCLLPTGRLSWLQWGYLPRCVPGQGEASASHLPHIWPLVGAKSDQQTSPGGLSLGAQATPLPWPCIEQTDVGVVPWALLGTGPG